MTPHHAFTQLTRSSRLAVALAAAAAAIAGTQSSAIAMACDDRDATDSCCGEALASGDWWLEFPDGAAYDCTGEAVVTSDDHPGLLECEARPAACLPGGGDSPGSQTDRPDTPGGGGSLPPAPEPCAPSVCDAAMDTCEAGAADEYSHCVGVFRGRTARKCGNGRTTGGAFRDGLTYEAGDLCWSLDPHGWDGPCSDHGIRSRGGVGYFSCPGPIGLWANCERLCWNNWMNGWMSDVVYGLVPKLSISFGGPTLSLSVSTSGPRMIPYDGYEGFCSAERASYHGLCAEGYLMCADAQEAMCPQLSGGDRRVWIRRAVEAVEAELR